MHKLQNGLSSQGFYGVNAVIPFRIEGPDAKSSDKHILLVQGNQRLTFPLDNHIMLRHQHGMKITGEWRQHPESFGHTRVLDHKNNIIGNANVSTDHVTAMYSFNKPYEVRCDHNRRADETPSRF